MRGDTGVSVSSTDWRLAWYPATGPQTTATSTAPALPLSRSGVSSQAVPAVIESSARSHAPSNWCLA